MCKHLTHKGFRQFVAGADLNCPLLSPVNALGVWARELNAEDALFGSPCLVVRRMEDGTITREEGRNTDGVWWGPAGGRRKEVERGALHGTDRSMEFRIPSREADLQPVGDCTAANVRTRDR